MDAKNKTALEAALERGRYWVGQDLWELRDGESCRRGTGSEADRKRMHGETCGWGLEASSVVDVQICFIK